MNEYPVWWDTTLSVFNKHEDSQTQIVTWYKTVVEKCFWKNANIKVNINTVVIETDNLLCRIPKDDRFLEFDKWIEQPNDTKEDYFTLRPGDIIVKGEIDDTINEYRNGQRSSDLLKKYKALGCMTIEEVAINVGPGRCNEHYFIKGI